MRALVVVILAAIIVPQSGFAKSGKKAVIEVLRTRKHNPEKDPKTVILDADEADDQDLDIFSQADGESGSRMVSACYKESANPKDTLADLKDILETLLKNSNKEAAKSGMRLPSRFIEGPAMIGGQLTAAIGTEEHSPHVTLELLIPKCK